MNNPLILKGYYDGWEFTKYCVINQVRPQLSAPRNNRFIKNVSVSGARFIRNYYEPISLEVDITIVKDVTYNMDRLNSIFHVAEPKKLMFSDRSDRYLMAILDGDIRMSNNYGVSKAKLKFVSPDYYWRYTGGNEIADFEYKNVIVNNRGTAPIYPTFEFEFRGDNGYLAVVAPNGYISLGNVTRADSVPAPRNEYALSEEMSSLSGWQKVTDLSNYLSDYSGWLIPSGDAKTDSDGIGIDESTITSDPNNFRGYAYVKEFKPSEIEETGNNFELTARVNLQDNSGDPNKKACILVAVLDADNKPIMYTQLFDTVSDRNGIAVHFGKHREGTNHGRDILKEQEISRVHGHIKMEKIGNRFTWRVWNRQGFEEKYVTQADESIRVGDTVYIKESARTAQTGHPILDFTRGRAYKVGSIFDGGGRKACTILYNGQITYHMWLSDVQTNKVNTSAQRISIGEEVVSHQVTANNLAQLVPAKVLIFQGTVKNQNYGLNKIDAVHVKRIYTSDRIKLKNEFMQGDTVTINNEEGYILKNGEPFTGQIDVDSRFFSVDGGKTDVSIVTSDWGSVPKGKVIYQSGWL